ncbi:MAG TPA: phenylalanine--tRNA ligase subunit beta [Pirellulales bacterium]|jgi:phenylalanyl-tRNA synthetase beta chain|nr:phenylalanine--tRNA ligase subunit beta [Pirellulales bacterium]
MIVSWNWLKQYVSLSMPPEEFERRLMLAGLNHENTKSVADDLAIDLEVTSNRPDCLGHLGIAREAAAIFGVPLTIPNPQPPQGKTSVAEFTKVTLQCPNLCNRYTARLLRGVKVQASPKSITDRLSTLGIAAINNVVDITNYVLMECGQPLHAFNFQKLDGREIIVREARKGERLEAINHKTYELEPGMCVIADRSRAVALGGVMGGANTEVTSSTTDVLIEAAEFDPLCIRNTARKLALHSDSSYRFERGIDSEGIEWASRRCCELILQIAGGELAAGIIDVGSKPSPRELIVLRYAQLKRILGIEIDRQRVEQILQSLNVNSLGSTEKEGKFIPPSWRRDLTREIDLVEEVARIHGYDAIPEDVNVPMAASQKTPRDRVLAKVRETLISAGIDEAMTLSVVSEAASEAFSPWTQLPALVSSTHILRRADRLRRSLIPSLLEARRNNEALANPSVELLEIARVYLSQAGALPDEPLMLGITSGADFFSVKGVLERIISRLNPEVSLEVADYTHELFRPSRAVELRLAGKRVGYLGEVSSAGLKMFELHGSTTVGEIKIAELEAIANLVPQATQLSTYPAVTRDLNLVVDDYVRWADMLATIRSAARSALETVEYRDTYRDPQRLGPGKKSQLLTITLRRQDGTLTNTEADSVRDEIVAACASTHGASLRA